MYPPFPQNLYMHGTLATAKQVVEGHFRFRAAEIMKRCDLWAKAEKDSCATSPDQPCNPTGMYGFPFALYQLGKGKQAASCMGALAEEIRALLTQKYGNNLLGIAT